MNTYTITSITKEDYPALVSVWESSVKATHHFLSEEDFNFYKNLMTTFFENVQLLALKDKQEVILGFMGTNGDNLEMLFVEDQQRGKGIGKQLLLHALENLGIKRVDVNQQNQQAVAFYHHFGFETKGLSEVDGFGKPYPILHLEYKKSNLV